MNKTDTAHTAQNETLNFTPLFGSDELKLQTTPKAVTPFAGMVSLFAWLGALEFPKRVAAVMPFEYRSPNAIAPEQTVMAFISAVVVGASRFAHAGWLRHDTAFHALLERRFVVLREKIREDKEAVGRRLLDVPGYTGDKSHGVSVGDLEGLQRAGDVGATDLGDEE